MAATAAPSTNSTTSTSTYPSSFRTSQTASTTTNMSSTQLDNNNNAGSSNALTQLPVVDFKFEELRKRMADFTVKFDAFIERGRKRVLEERNDFRGRLGEINEEQKSTNTQIASLHTTLNSHQALLTRESHEKVEMQQQISGLESHQQRQQLHCDRLRAAIAHTQRQIDVKLQAQREYADRMDGQARLNGPELAFWETYLGCRIEGAGDENLVRVVFGFPPVRTTATTTHQNGRKGEEDVGEREATFELRVPETAGGGYLVVHSQPKLTAEKVDRVVRRLNETRDIAVLLKGMRGLFAEELK